MLGTATVSNGSATFTTSSLFAGSHTFTLSYAGDSNTTASSSFGKLVVNQASTTVNLSSSPSSSLPGKTVTLTADVTVVAPGVATPSGTVAFYQGSTLLGTGSVSNGVASYVTAKLAVGTYSYTAVYRGDSHCLTSSAPSWTVKVANPPVIASVTLASANGLIRAALCRSAVATR